MKQQLRTRMEAEEPKMKTSELRRRSLQKLTSSANKKGKLSTNNELGGGHPPLSQDRNLPAVEIAPAMRSGQVRCPRGSVAPSLRAGRPWASYLMFQSLGSCRKVEKRVGHSVEGSTRVKCASVCTELK